MKIAIDVDDTITAFPEFFSEFTKAMRKAGHKIYIVTAVPEIWRVNREKELKAWGIDYDHLEFTAFKEEFCLDNDIDIAFDDCPGYYDNSIGTLIRLFKIRK